MDSLARLLPAPLPVILAVACIAAAVWFEIRSCKLVSLSIRSPGHPDQSRWMIRGVRHGILAIGFVSFAVGLWKFSAPWLLFGLVFLGEEIVETGVMLLALRRR